MPILPIISDVIRLNTLDEFYREEEINVEKDLHLLWRRKKLKDIALLVTHILLQLCRPRGSCDRHMVPSSNFCAIFRTSGLLHGHTALASNRLSSQARQLVNGFDRRESIVQIDLRDVCSHSCRARRDCKGLLI